MAKFVQKRVIKSTSVRTIPHFKNWNFNYYEDERTNN